SSVSSLLLALLRGYGVRFLRLDLNRILFLVLISCRFFRCSPFAFFASSGLRVSCSCVLSVSHCSRVSTGESSIVFVITLMWRGSFKARGGNRHLPGPRIVFNGTTLIYAIGAGITAAA